MKRPSDALLTWQYAKKLYEKIGAPVCVEYGLTHVERDIMLFLANNPDYDTATQIVEVRMLAKSHVSTSIESLVKKGFLRREPDPHERRLIHLRIEPAAEPLIQAARQKQREFGEILYRGFSIEEACQLEALMDRVAANILKGYQL